MLVSQASGPGVLEAPEALVGLEQRVLDGVLGIVVDPPRGRSCTGEELALGENPKAILRGRVARIAHAISSEKTSAEPPDIASVDGCNRNGR